MASSSSRSGSRSVLEYHCLRRCLSTVEISCSIDHLFVVISAIHNMRHWGLVRNFVITILVGSLMQIHLRFSKINNLWTSTTLICFASGPHLFLLIVGYWSIPLVQNICYLLNVTHETDIVWTQTLLIIFAILK